MKEKLSGEILNSFLMLTHFDRGDLWKRVTCELFLQREKDEKLLFLKEEVKRTINQLNNISDKDLIFSNYIVQNINNNNMFDSKFLTYSENYIKYFKDCILVTDEDIKEYNTYINKNKREFSKVRDFTKEVILPWEFQKREEIEKLPKVKTFIEVVTNLKHLESLYQTIEAVKENRPIENCIQTNSESNKIIKDLFLEQDIKGWEYFFNTEEIFFAYCDMLTLYVDGKEYEKPGQVIRLKPPCKTKTAKAIKKVCRRFGIKMSGNHELYDIMRVLSHFEKLTDDVIYEMLRK